MTTNISLNITGSCPERQWARTFVSDGSLTSDGIDTGRLPVAGENYGYTISHTDTHTVYRLVDYRVKLPDAADSDALLMVGISLPSQMQLQGAESPLDLLRLLYNTFVDEYMTATPDGYHAFTDKEINPAQFRSILSSYEPLAPSGSPYVLTTTRTGGMRPRAESAPPADEHGSQLFMAAVAGLILGFAIMWFAYPLFHGQAADEETAVQAVAVSPADESADRTTSLGEEIRQHHAQQAQKQAADTVRNDTTDSRGVVLKAVNDGVSIYRIRELAEWEQLSKGDKLAVEAVCNTKQHGDRKDTVEAYIKETYPEGFSSWEELEKARRKIFKLAPR